MYSKIPREILVNTYGGIQFKLVSIGYYLFRKLNKYLVNFVYYLEEKEN